MARGVPIAIMHGAFECPASRAKGEIRSPSDIRRPCIAISHSSLLFRLQAASDKLFCELLLFLMAYLALENSQDLVSERVFPQLSKV